FILMISEQSIAQETIQAEVQQAHLGYLKHGKPRIVPVRVRYDGPLDYEIECYIKELPTATWDGPQDDSAVLAHVARAIARTPASGSPPLGDRGPAITAPPSGRPNPAMDLRSLLCPGGTMALHDPLYVRRRCDDVVEVLATSDEGQTLIIKGPRQRGKSSL